MEWFEALGGVSAISICGYVLVLVSKSVLNKSSDTPALANAIEGLTNVLSVQITDSKEERLTYQAANRQIVTQLGKISEIMRDLVKGDDQTKSEVRILSAQIVSLENVVTNHTESKPTLEDILHEIKLLSQRVDDAMDKFNLEVTGVKIGLTDLETKVSKIKRDTQEVPVLVDLQESDAKIIKKSVDTQPIDKGSLPGKELS